MDAPEIAAPDSPETAPRRVTRADAFPDLPAPPPSPPVWGPPTPETVAALEAIQAADASRSATKSFFVSLVLGCGAIFCLIPLAVPTHRCGATESSAARRAEVREELARAAAEQGS